MNQINFRIKTEKNTKRVGDWETTIIKVFFMKTVVY